MANGYLTHRPTILGLSKLLVLAVGQLPFVQAAPVLLFQTFAAGGEGDDDGVQIWLYLVVAGVLVLLGGAFAGLTIALMGQDEIYLQVIKTSGEGAERKHAANVLSLLNRGKHWVLVTLLLSNVITNETLPIVLDRSLGGGWPAVLGSTVLIVIFGEIAPQSVCVRYGLPIGSWMAPFVLGLMYILAPVAWPTAKLLDWLLGEDHGTVYKKAGLKTLVSLHKSLGETGQQLNTDEVTIISAVLDLKDKSVGSIMTPMDNVFTMSLDDVLDEETMDVLLSQGYSRIPIHHPDNDENFVGMLLVKMLITYDPEDAKPVRDFALATLPETRPDTSCLDIVNFFQEGKSHMVLVSDHPGDDHGALGVVTLEDVIEELIGEEIIDESDVFIDVHKAIRRLAPAPKTRIPKGQVAKGQIVADPQPANGHESDLIDIHEDATLAPADLQREKTVDGSARPKTAVTALRRRSSATNSTSGDHKASNRQSSEQMREQLKHLGPSNLASRPKSTRYNTVKIKPGGTANASPQTSVGNPRVAPLRSTSATATDYQGGIGEGLVTSGGKSASDGVQALQTGYGSLGASPVERRPPSASKGVQVDTLEGSDDVDEDNRSDRRSRAEQRSPSHAVSTSRSRSTVRSLKSSTPAAPRMTARSGSITENVVEANGIRKVVLEPGTSSSSDGENGTTRANKSSPQVEKANSGAGSDGRSAGSSNGGTRADEENNDKNTTASTAKKKRRRRRKHPPGEQQPLLGDQH